MKQNSIWENYPREKRYILAMLQDIQREYDHLPKESLISVAEHLDIPLSEIYSMATFYKALSLTPKGQYAIRVCDGTACHIRGSAEIIEAIQSELEISPGETTEDGLFSIEIVNCLGACALAPVVMINDQYYGKMSRTRMIELINQCRRAEDE